MRDERHGRSAVRNVQWKTTLLTVLVVSFVPIPRSFSRVLPLLQSLIREAAAQSTGLQIALSSNRESYELTLTAPPNGHLCSYTLFGGESRSQLKGRMKKAVAIAYFAAAPGKMWIRIGSAPTFRKVRRRDSANKTLSFRTKLTCPWGSTFSGIDDAYAPRVTGGATKSARTWFAMLATALRASGSALRSMPLAQPIAFPVDAQPYASDGLAVAELSGRIRSVPSGRVLLDITDRVRTSTGVGLLGFAFHPSAGSLFVYYSELGTGNSVLSRFEPLTSDPSHFDPASESILLSIPPTVYDDHKGGQIAFGADGYLYLSLGDGGSEGDVLGNAQNRASLLGKILRLDVDTGTPYGIPPGNPYFGNSSGFREEIFAYGFRNPWRMSFDPATGVLWAGDVGQEVREEVDLVVGGGNYGWNAVEGTACYPPGTLCSHAGTTLPAHEYSHPIGFSITGGHVLRGGTLPILEGRYIFGDFVSGVISSLDAAAPQLGSRVEFRTDLALSSFGRDVRGNIVALSFLTGEIYRIEGV